LCVLFATVDKLLETNALTVAYSLRNIFAPFVNYLTTALKETTIIAINAEYVVLQTMKGTDTVTFAKRVSLIAISRTFAERMYFIMSVPSV
jgi:hypothetical protein